MRRSLGIAVFSGMLGVTMFGIFLTPVFFYVIQRMSEAPVFRQTAVKWVGSTILGALLGAFSGFLLGKLEVAPLWWAVPVGACVGALNVLAVLAVHKRIKAQQLLGPAGLYHVVRHLSSRWRSSDTDGDDSP
jgi:multidrug efflux pump